MRRPSRYIPPPRIEAALRLGTGSIEGPLCVQAHQRSRGRWRAWMRGGTYKRAVGWGVPLRVPDLICSTLIRRMLSCSWRCVVHIASGRCGLKVGSYLLERLQPLTRRRCSCRGRADCRRPLRRSGVGYLGGEAGQGRCHRPTTQGRRRQPLVLPRQHPRAGRRLLRPALGQDWRAAVSQPKAVRPI